MTNKPGSFEKILALIGLAACLLGVFWSWEMIAGQQPIWPLPGLYLIELIIVGITAADGILRGKILETWIVVGILFGFALMGAWSIGLAFIPSAVMFLVAALWASRKQSGIGKGVAIGVLACLIQIVLMFIFISTLGIF